MAGDWIKMRENLHEDPAILAIARRLETRPEHVVGYCHKFWSWVSRNCHDGTVTNVTLVSLESSLALPGFLSLMCEVGWLEYDDSDDHKPLIRIPKFERHLSQGAKERGLAAERQHRNRVAKTSRPERDKSVTREEKRREEKSNKNKTPCSSPTKFSAPTLSEVSAYCAERGNAVDPQRFLDYYTANGWRVGKSPMKDWRAAIRTWEKNATSQPARKNYTPTFADE